MNAFSVNDFASFLHNGTAVTCGHLAARSRAAAGSVPRGNPYYHSNRAIAATGAVPAAPATASTSAGS